MLIPCPSCGIKLKLADDKAGKKVRCPKCNTTFAAAPPSAPELREAVQEKPVPPTPAPRMPVRSPTPPEEPADVPILTRPEDGDKRRSPDTRQDGDEDDRDPPRRRRKEESDVDDDRPRRSRRDRDEDERRAPVKKKSKTALWVILSLCVTLFAFVCPGIAVFGRRLVLEPFFGAVQANSSLNNGKQVAQVLIDYDQKNGRLPPREGNDPGNKLRSWRVTLLPYMGYKDLYAEINASDPFNARANTILAMKMPTVFGDGTMGAAPLTPGEVFTGPNTLFPKKDVSLSLTGKDVPDGLSNTILLAETKGVHWMNPGDGIIPENARRDLKSPKCWIVMADGSARWIDLNKISDDVLQRLINPADGKVLPQDWDK